jgi:UPF0716 protein FxsA
MLAVLVLFVAELFVMVQVATRIGVLDTVALLVLMPMLGVWLVKRQGLTVFRRVHNTLDAGGVPHKEVIDGFLLLIAGILLIVPGFITDVAGLLLLLPPVRIGVRSLVLGSLARRTSMAFRIVDGVSRRVDIRDVRSRDITEPRPPPELDR